MVNINGLAALLTGIEVVVLVEWLRLTTTAAAGRTRTKVVSAVCDVP